MSTLERFGHKKEKEPKPSRYEYADGSRKLYDRGKPPDGVDTDIWHLALFFEQVAESYGESVAGLPICYTELAHRIHNCGIGGTDGYIEVVEDMIRLYWSREDSTDYAINDFCSITKWTYYYDTVMATRDRIELLKTASKVVQQDRERKPKKDTRTTVITKDYSEQELADKLREFKERN